VLLGDELQRRQLSHITTDYCRRTHVQPTASYHSCRCVFVFGGGEAGFGGAVGREGGLKIRL
jgi:hypothetical protein